MSVFMADFNGRTRRNRTSKRISNRLAIYVENPERFKRESPKVFQGGNMTTVSKNAAPVKTHRSKAKAEATRRGLLYALPDWLMIIMLFFVPIVLLVIMAGSRWSLMGGNRGWNFPDFY